jgi:hypothetical protein
MSLFQLLDDPVEQPFLVRALNERGGLDDDARRRYAAAIYAQAPERAEWLRLEVALHRAASPDPSVRARFDELTALCPPQWIELLRRDLLLNCGRAADERPRVRFTFECERRWESLAPTDDPRVRHCDECGESVHFADTVVEAEALARAGRCISVPGALARSASGRSVDKVVGRPDPIAWWADRIFSD